ncbi:MAG TPA: YsnF/AvaK domain-containing protein [Noviherbaspirillum sp.]|nr:YsnF/AvaK domain-containing protein [Noviherbaspirillum sp.]
MENTVIGVYDSYAQAQNAMNELLSSGFSRNQIQLNPDSDATTTQNIRSAGDETGGTGIGHFFRSLFGREEHREHRDVYSEAVRRGSVVLTVHADNDEQHDRAVELMNRYDPVDIDERASTWRSQGWTGYDETAPRYSQAEIERERGLYARGATGTQNLGSEESTRIPVMEEQLKVGKREVQRGGVRVYQHLREKAVHESVQLRQEHVNVERHPVDQPASEADLAAFKEGSVEMREMGEEPVVSKTARVVEEVVVGKNVTQETANIDDTVRRTDVEVEQLGAGTQTRGTDYADTMASADDADFRTHWQNAYGSSGGRYEEYDDAYRYGSTMAGSGRFKNYRWEDIEPDVRSDWESRHPGSTWDKVKDAVRYGAEKVSGRQRH